MIDWSAYKFRCSSLGSLMTGVNSGLTPTQADKYREFSERFKGVGRALTANQVLEFHRLGDKLSNKNTLSQTTKSYLERLWKSETFGRDTHLENKYLTKGIEVEEKAISLYSTVRGQLFLKNKKRFTNKFVSGEPDNLYYKVRDIKSSWDLDTYPMFATKIFNKDYYWQLQGYMWLTGYLRSELIYCLVDTPDHLIQDEIRKVSWHGGYIDMPQEIKDAIAKNMTFEDIDNRLRIKVLPLNYNPEAIENLKIQIALCRMYLKQLNLTLKPIR